MANYEPIDVTGQLLGKYVLIKRLARGGMAELFLARNTGLQGFEKIVVLKRILPHLAGNQDFVDMFLHEARLAATLEHPNIVHVSDFGRAGDDYFFVMAYVHGRDLLKFLRAVWATGKALPLSHAVTIAIETAAGLHYAHEHVGFDGQPLGIVHRDVSPSNVLITYDGHVKVVDFGIAKAAAHNDETKVGVRKGKASYMSPEQCKNASTIDHRSDLFSLGVVLWEMTTMKRLYRGSSDVSVMHTIVNEPAPRPSQTFPDYPPALEAIVMRCLERNPEQRYQSAEELQLDLETFARDQGLNSSTGALGRYMHQLFPADERALPWAGNTGHWPHVPPSASLSLEHSDDRATSVSLSSGHSPAASASNIASPTLGHTLVTSDPSMVASPHETSSTTTLDHSPRGQYAKAHPWRWVAGGAVLGVALALGVWTMGNGNRLSSADTAPTAGSRSGSGERSTPSEEDIAAMLVLVNQPNWLLALDYTRRHQLLDQLRAVPDASTQIDERLATSLDLLQASDAPEPCDQFARAITRIESNPEPYFASAISTASVPGDDPKCGGLDTRLEQLAQALGQHSG